MEKVSIDVDGNFELTITNDPEGPYTVTIIEHATGDKASIPLIELFIVMRDWAEGREAQKEES